MIDLALIEYCDLLRIYNTDIVFNNQNKSHLNFSLCAIGVCGIPRMASVLNVKVGQDQNNTSIYICHIPRQCYFDVQASPSSKSWNIS